MSKRITKVAVLGIDLGDRYGQVCGLDAVGERVVARGVKFPGAGLGGLLGKVAPCRVVIEAGTPTRWVKREAEGLGHVVKVVNPRKMRRIYENEDKSDVVDARELADAGLYRWERLPEVHLRDGESQEKLTVLRARDTLVRSRTSLVNAVRSVLKQEGVAVGKGSTEAFAKRARPAVPAGLATALVPLLEEIESLTARVKELDRWVEAAGARDPAVRSLRQVPGVGPVTAAAYVWTVGDAARFSKSRQAGSYLGLRPRRDQSGETDKQLRITKAGNPFLRRLLVGSAQYILGPFGPDTALRRWGLKLAERGGRRAKRKAVVAVARKLAVVLHRLWVTGEVYRPFPEVAVRSAA
jgi:transposase